MHNSDQDDPGYCSDDGPRGTAVAECTDESYTDLDDPGTKAYRQSQNEFQSQTYEYVWSDVW